MFILHYSQVTSPGIQPSFTLSIATNDHVVDVTLIKKQSINQSINQSPIPPPVLEPKRYLSPCTSQSKNKFWLEGPPPNLGGRGRVRGRVRYPVKAHHTEHNLLIETDTLSLFLQEPYDLQVLGWGTRPQIGGKGWGQGSKMVTFESVISVSYQLPIVTKALSLTVFAQLSFVTDRRTALGQQRRP